MLTLRAPPAPSQACSPLRYPGGKSWITPLLSPLLRRHPPLSRATALTEVFAGGASVSCRELSCRRDIWVHLNELDNDVLAFWQTVFGSQGRALSETVRGITHPHEHLRAVVHTREEQALQTLIRNRLNYGGLLQGAGRSRLIGGLAPRWYPRTLADRIGALHDRRQQVDLTGEDALRLLPRLRHHEGVIFVDPPYSVAPTSAGHLLYRHAALDHEQLMSLCADLQGPWVMTHEDHPLIRDLARHHQLDVRRLQMHSNAGVGRSELVIGRDLGWLRPTPTLFSEVAFGAPR